MKEARVTVPALARMQRAGNKIVMLTAYDFPFAHMLDRAGIDILLVGDSLGTCVQGHPTTLPVTLDEMIYHCRMVSRAARRCLVIADMPFGSYQAGLDDALANACRFVKEGGAHAVKLEGGAPITEAVQRMVEVGIPVERLLTNESVELFTRAESEPCELALSLVDEAQEAATAEPFPIDKQGRAHARLTHFSKIHP
ncbi:MAG: 3-methyl-2-oxobutanoate hydroxymethyltransferase, partial [Myxococcales bacterium]|nr:3-methyl-2-oxobutanoate hydroxymethyltransferase [Myxococcales bacterium]